MKYRYLILIGSVIVMMLVLSSCFMTQMPSSVNGSIVGANVIQEGTQIQFPSGCQLYVYGSTNGGALPNSNFAQGQTITVADVDGQIADGLAASTSDSNSFTTQAAWFAIGGFGISNAKYIQGFYGSNSGPGAGSGSGMEMASVNFTLSTSALVAVLGMASSQQSITFSGVNNLSIDVPSPNSNGTEAMSIAHAYLEPGTYTIQENTSAVAAGQDPNHQADLIGVLICSDTPFAATSNNPKIPIPISTTSTTLSSTISKPQFSFSLKNGITSEFNLE